MAPAWLFWLVALGLIALTLVVLARPLLRDGKTEQKAPEEIDAASAIYRDQKRQLDDDLATGAIGADEHARAQEELVRRLGSEIAKQSSANAAVPSRMPWIAAIVLVAIVPVASLLLYQILGNPAALTASATRSRFTDADVRAMVDQLATRMRSNPDDPKGWLLLARSYSALGRYSESIAAFEEAAKRSPPDAQLYADWADAAAMAQNRKLAGKPEELVARALAVDPNNRKALALSATAALERGDVDASLARWRELKQKTEPGSEDAREVDKVIAEVEAMKGTGPATRQPATSSATTAALTGRVELDPKLVSRIAPDDTVFVFARPADGARMPLAATKFRASQLPLTFRLDDSMSMMPDARLSSAPKVIVEARVTKSGQAKAMPGDLRGSSAPVAPSDSGVHIVINEIVP